MFFKLAEAGEDRVSFPHSSFFKTFIFLFYLLIFFFFFYKIPFQFPLLPYSTGVAHPQVGLGSGREWGYWSKKVQDVGEGSGFEHHESPAGAAGGRRPTGQARTYILGRKESPGAGLPKRQEGWLGGAGGRVFPKKKKKNE